MNLGTTADEQSAGAVYSFASPGDRRFIRSDRNGDAASGEGIVAGIFANERREGDFHPAAKIMPKMARDGEKDIGHIEGVSADAKQ
jgi:hypothetical protein